MPMKKGYHEGREPSMSEGWGSHCKSIPIIRWSYLGEGERLLLMVGLEIK
ncbi:hypothetical protein ACFLXC_03935 [Chloroflexota bacterium]